MRQLTKPIRKLELSRRSIRNKIGAVLTLLFFLSASGISLPLPAKAALEIEPGTGVFTYENDKVHSDLEMRVFYHAPEKISSETPVWFVIHGAARNADGYFKNWEPHIKDKDVILLAPEFTKKRFPGARSYNLANIEQKDGSIAPQEEWTYAIIERIFDQVRENLDLNDDSYLMFGHSAGSQFTHRMLFLMDQPRIAGAILGNAGWYTMPQNEIDFPYGLGGMKVSNKRLAEVFRLPIVVMLGDQDTDAEHSQLRKTEEAMAQGPHRFARGKTFFQAAKDQAEKMRVPFNWRLVIVPGVAHSNKDLAPVAARILDEIEKQRSR